MNEMNSVTREISPAVRGVTVALAAALVAALAAIFVFGAKDARAQEASVEINPGKINLGDVAANSGEPTRITLNNKGVSDTTIGGLDLNSEGLQGLDLSDIRLRDPETGREFAVDTVTGLLQLLDPVTGLPVLDPITGLPVLSTINIPATGERALDLIVTPSAAGPFKGVVEFLGGGSMSNTVVQTVTVSGEARECSNLGQTEGNDTVTDTPADEVICGLGGDDTINATAGGDDIILGGAGNDNITFKDKVKKEFANGNAGQDLCGKKAKDKKDKIKSCGKKPNKLK